MKKLIAGVILLGLLGACSNKKAKIDPFASITQEVDSIRHKADSIHLDECRKIRSLYRLTNLSTISSIILLPMMCCNVSV